MIKRITRLLEMGGTMLATHHDCGAPLFRYKGDIVCPICSFDPDEGTAVDRPESPLSPESENGIISSDKTPEDPDLDLERLESIENEESRSAQTTGAMESSISSETALSTQSKARTLKDESGVGREADQVKEVLQKAVLSKLQDISNKMEEEKDAKQLKNQLECINEALKVLEALKR